MKKKIILSADSACDIGPALAKRFDVQFFQFHIQLEEETYRDGIDISADELYKAWWERSQLPKTAAITPPEYVDFFKDWVAAGHEVIHLNLGSALSSAWQNAKLAAGELEGVYVVDSASLSTGFGLLVVKAGEMIAAGLPAADIARALEGMKQKTHASFVLDTLEFMRAGGRCSAVAAFGANLLGLKAGIRVDNSAAGQMGVFKKFRGGLEKVLPEYVRGQLEGRSDLDLDRIFITHSGSPQSDIDLVKKEIEKYASFEETYVTRASCTISAHCGPRTLGVLFMSK